MGLIETVFAFIALGVFFGIMEQWLYHVPECECDPPWYSASDGRCGVCAGTQPQGLTRGREEPKD